MIISKNQRVFTINYAVYKLWTRRNFLLLIRTKLEILVHVEFTKKIICVVSLLRHRCLERTSIPRRF